MNRNEAPVLSIKQQQQQQQAACPLTESMSFDIAVAPPSGATLTRHESKNRKDGPQLHLIVSYLERHY